MKLLGQTIEKYQSKDVNKDLRLTSKPTVLTISPHCLHGSFLPEDKVEVSSHGIQGLSELASFIPPPSSPAASDTVLVFLQRQALCHAPSLTSGLIHDPLDLHASRDAVHPPFPLTTSPEILPHLLPFCAPILPCPHLLHWSPWQQVPRRQGLRYSPWHLQPQHSTWHSVGVHQSHSTNH